jgi:hypothetical protein
MSATFHVLAFKALGIDDLLLPATIPDGFNGDPYLTAMDYERLCDYVCGRVKYYTSGEWWNAGEEKRTEMLAVALAAGPPSAKQRLLNAIRDEQSILDMHSNTPHTKVDWAAGRRELLQLWQHELGVRAAPPEIKTPTNHQEACDALYEFHRAVEALPDSTAPSRDPPPADSTATQLEWTRPGGLSQWAKVFGFSPTTLKRRFNDGKIRHKKLSTKSYQVAVDDLPSDQQSKFRTGPK